MENGNALDGLVGGHDRSSHVLGLFPRWHTSSRGGDCNQTRLWDIASGQRLWGGGDCFLSIIYTLAFSPDGLRLAGGNTYGSTVGNAATGEGDVLSLERHKTVSTVFSPDGTKLARAVHINPEEYDPLMGYARILDASNYAVLHTLTGHSNHVYSVDFSPDGQLLLTTSLDGTARLWNVSDGSLVRVVEGGGGVFGKFSADGKTFFTCAGIGTVDFLYDTGTLKFWRTSDGALLARFDNLGAGPIAVSPAGKYFAYGTGGALVVAYIPLWIETITRTNNEITLRWQGGSGLYQVQARPHLDKGAWHSHGPPTTNTTFTHTTRSHLFYRVQSLPNPLKGS